MKHIIESAEQYAVQGGPLTLEHIRVLRGANYFSGGPVIHMRVNLNEFDEVLTNDIHGFYEGLAMTIPTLIEHHCSEGMRGGFFIRVKDGTLLGHVIEHVAIELQTLAGMDVSYGKTRSTKNPGVYNIVFRYFDDYAGLYAGKASINLVNAILRKETFHLLEVIEQLILIREAHLPSKFSQSLVMEAEKRQIPWIRNNDPNSIQIGSGKFQKIIDPGMKSAPAGFLDAPQYFDHLFSNDTRCHIPLVSVTGSKGKTLCTEIIGKGLAEMGFKTGITNSKGVFFRSKHNFQSVDEEPFHADILLKNPELEAVVVETPVETIIHEGLSYQMSDVGIVLNVYDNHISELDIQRRDDLAYAKSVVAEEVRNDGLSILNACDPLVAEMKERVYCEIIWFSNDPDNALTKQLLAKNKNILLAGHETMSLFKQGQSVLNIETRNFSRFFNEKGKLYESVMAAVCALHHFGADSQLIEEVLRDM